MHPLATFLRLVHFGSISGSNWDAGGPPHFHVSAASSALLCLAVSERLH